MLAFHFLILKCNHLCKVECLTHEFVYRKNKYSVFAYPVLSSPRKNQCFQKKDTVISKTRFLKKRQKHQNNSYHATIMEDAFGLIDQFEFPESIPMQKDSTLSSRMATYPIISKSTETVVLLLGKQGFGFHGRRKSTYGYENKAENDRKEGNISEIRAENLGNFLMMLKEIAEFCPMLDQHLKFPNKEKLHLSESKKPKRNDQCY